ncbi:MAG TPA: hypothetical protein VFE32_19840 [Puia sp.]|jgi:hypothetical protein|nr:hypothetical protein [Puia sp.]
MENLMTSPAEVQPKELIKPINVEELLKEEKVIEALCETRDSCGFSNSSIGKNDDILF